MSREDALRQAIGYVTSGQLPPQLQATPDLIVETARKFHDFLTEGPAEGSEQPQAADLTF